MPTGGVNLENIASFRDAGATAFGVGSSLVNSSETVTAAWLSSLTAKAALFVKAVAGG
jgi:2-dehydro-3-deoxyphosphogluconate aldolase/(4S)-4-hydroxy-2-oxoglutarate aldolase